MDILMLSPVPPPSGGIASWTNIFIAYCDKNNVPMRIVDTSVKGKRAGHESLRHNYVDEIKRSIGIFNNLRNEIGKKKPTVMHINTACAPLGIVRDAICLKYALRKNIPVVMQCHCNVEDQLHTNLQKKVFSLMIKEASQIIVLNEKSLNYVKEINEKKVCILPNFISEENVALIHHISTKIKTVLYVGHIEFAKGIKELLLVAEMLPDIRFVLVGAVREDSVILNKPDNVVLVGRVSQEKVKKYLEEADLFLFPSHSEGFSIALLEAMAAGLPVVATDVGANRDMLGIDGGIIVPIGDPAAIVAAVDNLLNDTSMRRKMSQKNINKVKNEYLVNVVMGKLINIYRELS